MTTLKTLWFAALVSTAVLTSPSLLAWGEPAGSEVDTVNGVLNSITLDDNGYTQPAPPYRPPYYHPPVDSGFERERREFPMHSRRIDERQHHQASLIENAYRVGRLSDDDYSDLKYEQNDIHRTESMMKADLRLSRREIAQLNDLLDDASYRIKMITGEARPYDRFER